MRAILLVSLLVVGCADEDDPDPTHGDVFPDGYGVTVHLTSPVAFDELTTDLRAGAAVYTGGTITMYDYMSAFGSRRDHAAFTALRDSTPVATGEVDDLQYVRVGQSLGAEVSLTLTPL
jgi:hypothetical protein